MGPRKHAAPHSCAVGWFSQPHQAHSFVPTYPFTHWLAAPCRAEFGTREYRENQYILVEVDELLQVLEDTQMVISTIKGSQFVEPIREVRGSPSHPQHRRWGFGGHYWEFAFCPGHRTRLVGPTSEHACRDTEAMARLSEALAWPREYIHGRRRSPAARQRDSHVQGVPQILAWSVFWRTSTR